VRLISIVNAGTRNAAIASLQAGPGSASGKIAKPLAGYVYREGTDYRCSDCWQFITDKQRCLSHGPGDVIKPNGYCIYWTYGTPVRDGQPKSSVSKEESAYAEKPNGTKCRRCVNSQFPTCKRVDGTIQSNACCNLQTPR